MRDGVRQLGGQRLGLRAPRAVVHDDPRALGGEEPRGRGADAARGARDERDGAGQAGVHAAQPSFAGRVELEHAAGQPLREHLGGEDRGVARAVDRHAGDRHAGRHLHDREQGVQPVERLAADRHGDHRQLRVRRDDAGQPGRAGARADQHAQAAQHGGGGVLGDAARVVVHAQQPQLVGDAAAGQLREGVGHDVAVRLVGHQHAHQRPLGVQLGEELLQGGRRLGRGGLGCLGHVAPSGSRGLAPGGRQRDVGAPLRAVEADALDAGVGPLARRGQRVAERRDGEHPPAGRRQPPVAQGGAGVEDERAGRPRPPRRRRSARRPRSTRGSRATP